MYPDDNERADPEVATRRPGPWPELNQRVEIFASTWGTWLPSRAEVARWGLAPAA